MPTRLPKPCARPSCPKLTHQRFCEEHQRKAEEEERFFRGKTAERGYGARWQRYRKAYLSSHPLCVQCGRQALVVDHIIPLSKGGEMWDEANHQALCESCHNKKRATTDKI